MAYVLLRLPFEVANGPNDSSLISELLFDLTNDILDDGTFDSKVLHSPIEPELVRPTKRTEDHTEYGKARPLFIDVSFTFAATDGCIDDMITIVLDKGNWVEKARWACGTQGQDG